MQSRKLDFTRKCPEFRPYLLKGNIARFFILKILVTGSTGFFGKSIVTRLKQSGHVVMGAAR